MNMPFVNYKTNLLVRHMRNTINLFMKVGAFPFPAIFLTYPVVPRLTNSNDLHSFYQLLLAKTPASTLTYNKKLTQHSITDRNTPCCFLL